MMMRTHTCGALRKTDIGKKVTLSGWVQSNRDHGGLVFIDLRDRYGLTQVVFDPAHDQTSLAIAEKLRREDVVTVSGTVRARKEGMVNPNLDTGEIEMLSDTIVILNKAEVPPLEIDDRRPASEEMRMKYRYLDLRRPIMQQRFLIRHKAAMAAREFLAGQDFLEIETPILMKSTPEGARDYIVPSRVNLGEFYALPQSPQLYKQILMVSGFDRYFQLARCLRDEDLRADRQPEFTQIDIEMSFVTQDDIFKVGEGLVANIIKKSIGQEIKIPFPRIPYKESMEKYGNDKPDLRFELHLSNVSDIVSRSDFQVFQSIVAEGGIVKAITPKKDFTRKELDEYIAFCQKLGAKGMSYMKVVSGKLESNIAKYFPEALQAELIERTGAEEGSTLMFIAGKPKLVNGVLSRLRNQLGLDLKLYDPSEFRLAWIVDFPMFEWDEENQAWSPAHHMFTMPKREHIEMIDSDPGKVYAECYDMVLNGVELASGSIRIWNPDLQKKIMDVVGFPEEKAQRMFGLLLEAFKYGAPPHGGFAIGFDRLVAMMNGTSDIREVIAFPKNKNAQGLMDGCPSEVDPKQLKELSIKLDFIKKEEKKADVFSKLSELLSKNGVQFEHVKHQHVNTSEEAAKARGTKLRQGAKALVLKSDNGFFMAVLSAEDELDFGKLELLSGRKDVTLASADEVKHATGVSIGAVPPFASLFSLPLFVDNNLSRNQQIAFNAGTHTDSIKMGFGDFKRTEKPTMGDFAKPKA